MLRGTLEIFSSARRNTSDGKTLVTDQVEAEPLMLRIQLAVKFVWDGFRLYDAPWRMSLGPEIRRIGHLTGPRN